MTKRLSNLVVLDRYQRGCPPPPLQNATGNQRKAARVSPLADDLQFVLQQRAAIRPILLRDAS